MWRSRRIAREAIFMLELSPRIGGTLSVFGERWAMDSNWSSPGIAEAPDWSGTWKSRRRFGRPTVPADIRALIRTMSRTNLVHGELQTLEHFGVFARL
jgi:hypothetical protein